jgi:large subunit ribosomal protein L25
MLKLNISPREAAGKQLGTIRAGGSIPGVLYGPGREPMSVTIPRGEFESVYAKAGTSTLIEANIEGAGSQVVVVRGVQRHPVKGMLRHADLLAVKMDEKMVVQVPLVFVGESPLEKSGEGVVVKSLHELEIEALPKDLPHDIPVDISGFATLDAEITVADLKLPPGVEALDDGEIVVVNVIAMREEELEEGAPEGEEVPEDAKEAPEGEEGAASAEESNNDKNEDE